MPGRIAVVDDEEVIRELLVEILIDRGYEVVTFGTRGEALAGLAEQAPELLIVDVRLPDGCGLDLISSLRTLAGRKVPAIVLSGMREERDFMRGFAAGAVDYLGKPFVREELLARVGLHLSRAGAAGPESRTFDEIPTKDGLSFGRYQIGMEIGRGGYGRVYLAEDAQRGGARVALKVLAPLSSDQEETRIRFIRETYALASVQHENVVRIHDVGFSEGWLYYAMEHVQGETLAGLLQEVGTLDEPSAILLARGLLGALSSIAEAGVLHRDLKPQNIMLRDRRVDSPVLIDFGLARRAIDRGITHADVLVGTVAYLPPEVIRGLAPDERSDLFALGLTLRAALAGEEIFPELEGVDLLHAIAHGPIPPPPSGLSPAFASYLAMLCALEPEDRPASAADALALLEVISEADAAAKAVTAGGQSQGRDGSTEVVARPRP